MKRKKFDALLSSEEKEALTLLMIHDDAPSLAAEIRLLIRRRATLLELWPSDSVLTLAEQYEKAHQAAKRL